MAQEALKTQIDSLQWEINRLDSENQKLRDINPERSQFVDMEDELSLAKEDITNLTAEVNLQRQQLAERDERITEDEREITELSKEIESLTATVQELRVSASQLQTAVEEAEQRRSEAEEQLLTSNSQVSHLGDTCAMLQQENRQLKRDGELELYRAVEEERRKWEVRESRMLAEIMELKRRASIGETTLDTRGMREGVPVASDTFAVRHSNSIVPPAVTTSLLATSVVPAPVVFSSSQQLSSVGVSSSLLQVSSSVVPTPVVFSSNQQLTSFGISGRSHVSSSVVPTPVEFSNSQLSTSVDMSDVSHGYNSQVSLLTGNSLCAPTSLPLLPALGSAIGQPLSKVVPIYGNQLPPIPRFTGEEDLTESGSFPDWFEQYEAVATLAGWDEHAKLVNLIKGNCVLILSFMYR